MIPLFNHACKQHASPIAGRNATEHGSNAECFWSQLLRPALPGLASGFVGGGRAPIRSLIHRTKGTNWVLGELKLLLSPAPHNWDSMGVAFSWTGRKLYRRSRYRRGSCSTGLGQPPCAIIAGPSIDARAAVPDPPATALLLEEQSWAEGSVGERHDASYSSPVRFWFKKLGRVSNGQRRGPSS